MSAKKRLFKYVKENGLKKYSTSELSKVGQIDSWARVWRQMKQDGTLDFEYDSSSQLYTVNFINDTIKKSSRAAINKKVRYRILNRDNHRCQACGKTAKEDKVKLHVDHRVPLDMGGSNKDENLWTLCSDCNEGKKNLFKDELDSEVMKEVLKEKSGYQRLLTLFKNSPNIHFEPSTLQGIAKIRDWTRTIRDIRDKHKLDIEYISPNKDYPNGAYVFKN